MWLARTATGPQPASKGAAGACPACEEPVIPKCGPIVSWHWAHRVNDCDPWAEPESAWHLRWKARGYRSEVVMRKDGQCHRADIVTPTGLVIELQSHYLDLPAIEARERFYGRMVWLYRADWEDRLHFGQKGFWWKHGSKAMAQSRRPIFWDLGDLIWRVSLGLVEVEHDEFATRVLGRVRSTIPRDRFEKWIGGAWGQRRLFRDRPPRPRYAHQEDV